MPSPSTSTDEALLGRLAKITELYYGPYAGGCAANAANGQVGGGVPGDGPAPDDAWGYQSCTETLHNFSTPSGAWRRYSFDLGAISRLCASYYGVTPDMHRLERWSGGYAIAERNLTSNLIWSNGKLDPWHGGGFLRQEDAVPGGAVFVMEKTAHHEDLRAPCAADPAELTKVREQEEALITSWINEASAA